MTFTLHHAQPILDVIGKHESRGGDYNIVWGGIKGAHHPPKPITQMTVSQVLAWQDSIDPLYQSEAAGKYQILEDTLRGLVKSKGINTSRLFDEQMQDELACHLLIGRGFQSYLDGQISIESMMLNLAKEWASFPVPTGSKAGRSYYAGDGLNKAHASINEVHNALVECWTRYRSGSQPAAPSTPNIPTPESPLPGFLIAALIVGVAALLVIVKG